MSAMKNIPTIICAAMAGLGGCAGASGGTTKGGSDSASLDAAGMPPGGNLGGTFGGPAYGSGGTGGSGAGTTAPPEVETKVDYLAPSAGDRRVYVANPTRNTVTVIDSATLGIVEQATGDTPTVVATVPGKDIALVINAGSHTLRILREATPGLTSYPIVAKANAISISPDGLHAVVWFDSSQKSPSTPSGPSAGSTQEVSVVDLGAASAGDQVISVSVGYNPSAVVFASDSSAAFVVTDDGISELRFANITGPTIAPFTRIDDDSVTISAPDAGAPASPDAGVLPDSAPAPVVADGGVSSYDGGGATGDSGTDLGSLRDASPAGPDSAPDTVPAATKGKAVDVSVTMSGDWAIARRAGTAAVLLVDLKARKVSTTLLSSEVTDLDLVNAPSGPQAFAVLRGESKLVRIDVPAGFGDASHQKSWFFTGATIGSVTISGKGSDALLYTTAVPSKDLAIFDLLNEQVLHQPDIHKNIRAVAIAPDEKTALILHTRSTPTSTSTNLTQQEIDDQSYGYTMVNLTTSYAKLLTTQADPNPFAITPDSSNAFVLLRDDKASLRIAEKIDLTSFLATDVRLGSPPNSIGTLSPMTQKVFIGQEYSEGRISFINWVTGGVETVTGFALSGRIQQ
jgi:hypothetical protein